MKMSIRDILMKCIKISQTNQFGNNEPTRAGDYLEDQSDLDRTELGLKNKKRKKDMKISKNFKINVKTAQNYNWDEIERTNGLIKDLNLRIAPDGFYMPYELEESLDHSFSLVYHEKDGAFKYILKDVPIENIISAVEQEIEEQVASQDPNNTYDPEFDF